MVLLWVSRKVSLEIFDKEKFVRWIIHIGCNKFVIQYKRINFAE